MDRPRAAGRFGGCRVVAVLLLAGALVLVQAVLAAHQVDHLTAPGSEHGCPLCLAGHGLDQAGPSYTTSLPPSARDHHQPITGLPCLHLGRRAPYQVRAPPPAPAIA